MIVAGAEVRLAHRGADERLGVGRPHVGVARQIGAGIRVSTDGRRHALNNSFIQRFWRYLRYEETYSRGYATVPDLGGGLQGCFALHNVERAHQGRVTLAR